MDSRLTKFYQRILVSSIVVFILLSASTNAEEATRCYWCGPLADQVHRSQRAPSCDTFDLDQHRIVCDKGYTHCAIVATSPPYAESRLCVKFYQDECYSLYCNSTKTWRMVCACRGDLCNGRPTDREIKAFAAVPRTLETSRAKRTLISGFISVKTKTPADNNTIIIINNKTGHDITINNLQSDQPSEFTENTSTAHNMDHTKVIEDNIIIELGTINNLESIMTHAYVSQVETNDDEMDSTPTTMAAAVATESKLDNAVMDKPTTPNLEYTTLAEFLKESQGSDPTSMKPTSNEAEVKVVPNSISPLKLPPAEALQQTVTPTKAMALTTVPTVMTTENNHLIETTTQSHKIINMTKNVGAQNVAYLIIFLITFLIHYCL